KQQIDHLGYQVPRRQRKAKQAGAGNHVNVVGARRFAIDGFEWALDDFVKNAVVFGQVGSGKTACVLNNILEGLMASCAESGLEIGGLLLDAKGDFYDKIQTLCARYGREQSLLILDPSAWEWASNTPRSIAWNPLDNNDDALEIATRLIAALRLIGIEL